MRYLCTALALLLLVTQMHAAAIVGGLRVNTDTTGTNTTSVRVTVSGQTNLNAGAVRATNNVTVGTTGQAGSVTLGSTTSSNYVTFTTTSSNMFAIVNTTDAYNHAAFNLVVTNEISQADLLHIYNGTNVQVYIQYDGSILGQRLLAEDSPGSDDFTRIQPTNFRITQNAIGNYFLVDVTTGDFDMVHLGTNTFHLAQDSGYLGGGTLVLTDDGTYKSVSGVGAGGGNVLNTGASATGQVPAYTDTTGTNVAPSSALLLSGTNVSVVGTLTADGVVSTNWVYVATSTPVTTAGSTNTFTFKDLTDVSNTLPGQIGAACSDETTALTTGTAKVTFRMPYAMTVTEVRASLTTAQSSGSIFTVDINEGGVSILSTKLTIDNGELTSTTAATPPVISDSSLADDASITVDIDQVGDGTAKGLKIWLIGKY